MLLEYFVFGVMPFLLTVHCKTTEVLVEAGSQAILPCKSSPSHRNPPIIMWRKDNNGTVWRRERSGLQYWGVQWSPKRTKRFQCPHDQFERGDYSLQIDNVMVEDAGIYSCRVTHGNRGTEEVIILRVITVSISTAVPIWGQELAISCNVFPRIESATVRWTLNDDPSVIWPQAPSNGDTTLSVVKEKASMNLAGKWTCTVGYEGKEGRASATVTVKGIVQPLKEDTKVYAAVGSNVMLPCVFSPGLIPLNTLWEKVTSESLFGPIAGDLPASFSPPSSSSQAPMDRSATLKEVELKDEGRYRCSGIVEGRRLTRNMELVVAKIESTTPSKKRDSVTLTCQLTTTSEVTNYEWVHVTYDLNGTQQAETAFTGKTVIIDRVSEENRGEWVCRFYGKEGILGNVTHHLQLMSRTGKESPGPSYNTSAVVGLSFLLAFLLLVLIKMFKNHQRRQRILQYPALETIVHTNSNEREARERETRTK